MQRGMTIAHPSTDWACNRTTVIPLINPIPGLQFPTRPSSRLISSLLRLATSVLTIVKHLIIAAGLIATKWVSESVVCLLIDLLVKVSPH